MQIKFIEERFPDDISYGSLGGPQYSTNIVSGVNGFEQRNINWSEAIGIYNVAHGVKTEAQWLRLLAFFRVCKGRAIGFRFKDWSDYKAKAELIGVGDGISSTFKLIKSYFVNNSNDIKEVRRIKKPVEGSVKIYCDGVEYTNTNVKHQSGEVLFDKAPKTGVMITADFEFDIPARFDTDHLASSIEAQGIYSWNNIPIVEIRV